MASGKIDFPTHMKNVHQDWLGTNGSGDLVDTVTNSVVAAMNAAISTSPYASKTPLDPSSELAAMDTSIAVFAALVTAIDADGDWGSALDYAESAIDDLISDDFINTATNAQSAYLDDELNDNILPKFKAGMRDINAVMASAFVIGESVILAKKVRDVAKFRSDLSGKLELTRNEMVVNAADGIMRIIIGKAELQKTVTHYTMEANRLRVVAEKEEEDSTIAIAVGDAKWDLELYQYGSNVMAAISGAAAGVPSNSSKSPSTTRTALASALAGASIGGQVGGGAGAAIGGAVGLGLGALFG